MPGMPVKTDDDKIDYMTATLKDMQLPRGRLLIVESRKEIEITKKGDENGNKE